MQRLAEIGRLAFSGQAKDLKKCGLAISKKVSIIAIGGLRKK